MVSRSSGEIVDQLKLARVPTPITTIAEFAPLTIHIKRDDLTGLLTTGNKIRKLSYLLSEAKTQGAEVVITCGGIQSNHARATVIACRRVGLQPLLVLRGEPPSFLEGNFFIDSLAGADFRFITKAEYENVDRIMEEIKKGLELMGKKAYIIPEGGSNEVGALGYRDCFYELYDYLIANRIEKIYLPVGSGGTYAGMLIGKKLKGASTRLVGVIVCDTIEYLTGRIKDIVNRAIERFGYDFDLENDDIELIDYQGEGYGIPYPEEIEIIKRLARKGIFLEPIYTGKAFYGMVKEESHGNILFLHTGGLFGLFPYREQFQSAS
ncbi:D-cysteine desulfhydrase family protein [candidate division WOR-3 bacterium]|uniref:D-cysteine desulfhydrase family protein n=1 Tax=candidate division WOR-3 bacterium TaxID=2052148 RepID=A0A660SKF5_UNCW3|nr:MAG: D-cysteine desulfhydrase family protein [candidate division WOR-3 bacterium]